MNYFNVPAGQGLFVPWLNLQQTLSSETPGGKQVLERLRRD
jgi:hypothetical protein